MCGIFFSLSASQHVYPTEKTVAWLQNRGPDNYQTHQVQLNCPADPQGVGELATTTVYLTFISTVLGLRGDHVTSQPLVDADSRSVLCWNGEAWKVRGETVEGNDTELVFRRLIEASKLRNGDNESEVDQATKTIVRLTNIINNITGPFSFVFYDGFHGRIFFGRDCLGRRSLLHSRDEIGTLKICSTCDGTPSVPFEEVETDGIYTIDLSRLSLQTHPTDSSTLSYQVEVIPWSSEANPTSSLKNPIPPMNQALPSSQPPALRISSPCVERLEYELRRSLDTRIRNVPRLGVGSNTKIAVLFSGGLDCTILARLAHDILPLDQPIDLLNVSFENPRVAAALKAKSEKDNTHMGSIYESCPDRITGRAGYGELQRVCPDRLWRFVAVDVPYAEFVSHREEVIQLMKPHNTEMDLSIACALYFASRGQGTIHTTHDHTAAYTTTARVLLSGLGADELFAGYGRHGVSFTRNGFQGLINEIDLDVGRLGKRNLGRDDRVISNWGREARFPYLDEEFVSWTTQTPVWERCGFGTAEIVDTEINELDQLTESLDPEKKSLRLLALKLGMVQTAREKKRAIQFGSRTAKMESGKSKGTQLI
ncbi:asparagine synthase [Talaromyces proteolyticus]|uniref:Asparagine synthase n=1 Tax=Talaromyces proteolyticus TaxID=1131652 RepID=A0AAD4KUU7_9EURO|nr:asparagine synthase [Talaromyces proteolyticus]KAH8697465.1 asparagine synthase [Talaromyces proteolyticus]